MAVATGLASQLGIGVEGTVGTAVTPDRFFEYNQESIKYSIERIESKGLRPSRKFTDHWVAGRQGGEGDVEFDVMPNGFGIIPTYMIGGTAATTTPGGATNARLHTVKVGALDAKSLTVQVGRPTNTGAVTPFTYAGAKVDNWELNMEAPSGLLTCKLGLDVMTETTATTLATASYAASNVLIPWSDANCAITVGGSTYSVKKVTLSGNNNLKKDRYALGSSTKKEALEGTDEREYTGTIDLESYAGTTAYNLFKNGTEAAIVCTFTGAEIESGQNYMVRVSIARVRFDGETPTVGGPDLLDNSLPFKVLYTSDSATEIKIETQNSDTSA